MTKMLFGVVGVLLVLAGVAWKALHRGPASLEQEAVRFFPDFPRNEASDPDSLVARFVDSENRTSPRDDSGGLVEDAHGAPAGEAELLERPFGEPQTVEERLERILGIFEVFKNATGSRKSRAAYLTSAYCVATVLDRQGRTAPPWDTSTPPVGPDEWEVLTMGARYVFPKNEFPAYSATRLRYVESQGHLLDPQTSEDGRSSAELPVTPFPAEIEEILDNLVERSLALLTRENKVK